MKTELNEHELVAMLLVAYRAVVAHAEKDGGTISQANAIEVAASNLAVYLTGSAPLPVVEAVDAGKSKMTLTQ